MTKHQTNRRQIAVLEKLDAGPLTVQVEQRHIDNGIPEDEHHCPIALALNEATARLCDNLVFTTRITIACTRRYNCADPEIRQWILMYDRGDPVPPFTIRLQGDHIHGYWANAVPTGEADDEAGPLTNSADQELT